MDGVRRNVRLYLSGSVCFHSSNTFSYHKPLDSVPYFKSHGCTHKIRLIDRLERVVIKIIIVVATITFRCS